MKTLNKKQLAILGIQQLKIPCIVGIYPEERHSPQLLLVDVKIQLDLSTCFESENIQDTLDYVLLAEISKKLAYEKHYFLIEIFARDLLEEYFNQFPFIQWAWVRIQKPSAIPAADYAYVELEKRWEKAI